MIIQYRQYANSCVEKENVFMVSKESLFFNILSLNVLHEWMHLWIDWAQFCPSFYSYLKLQSIKGLSVNNLSVPWISLLWFGFLSVPHNIMTLFGGKAYIVSFIWEQIGTHTQLWKEIGRPRMDLSSRATEISPKMIAGPKLGSQNPLLDFWSQIWNWQGLLTTVAWTDSVSGHSGSQKLIKGKID